MTDTPQYNDINKMLWELQLFTELHTPGMRILLDKERAKYVTSINQKIQAEVVAARLKAEHYWIKYYGDQRNFFNGSDGDMPSINELKRHQQLHKYNLAALTPTNDKEQV